MNVWENSVGGKKKERKKKEKKFKQENDTYNMIYRESKVNYQEVT